MERFRLVAALSGVDPEGSKTPPKRKVGRRVGELPSPPPCDDRSTCFGFARDRAREGALSDPRFSRDRSDRSTTGERSLEPRAKGIEGGVTTDESVHRGRAGAYHRSRTSCARATRGKVPAERPGSHGLIEMVSELGEVVADAADRVAESFLYGR